MEHRAFDSLWHARGVALSFLGTLIFGTSSLVVTLLQQPAFVLLGALSVPAISLAYSATRDPTKVGGRLLVVSAACLMAAQISAVILWFPTAGALAYSSATMIGGLLALRGITEPS